MPKESAEPKKEQKSSSFKLIVILLLSLNMLIGGAAAGYFVFMKPSGAETPPEPASFAMDEMLVNLADASGMHYLRCTAVLEYAEDQKGLAEELAENKHILQHSIIALLRTKKLADVQPPGSIEDVQREMTAEINKQLKKGKITRVYFTEYLTQ